MDMELLTDSGSNQEIDDNSATPKIRASEQVMEAMEKAAKPTKHVPEPDGFASKRQKADKEFMDSLVQQGKATTKVAEAFGKALEAPSTATAPPPAQVQPDKQCPMVLAIKFALQSVAEENKLRCMTEILTLISTKYVNK